MNLFELSVLGVVMLSIFSVGFELVVVIDDVGLRL